MNPFKYIKRFMPRSLYGRTLMIIILPMILMQISLGYIFFDRHTNTILRQISTTLAGNIAIATTLIPQTPSLTSLFENRMQFQITYKPGAKIRTPHVVSTDWVAPFMQEALSATLELPYVLSVDQDYIYVTVDVSKGTIDFKFLRKKLFSRTTPIVIIWTTISALLLSLIAALFMKNQVRPIRQLADAADKFGKDIDVERFRPEGAEEVRRAGVAFNIMRERLKRQLRERTEMLAGVSHDLRTPLSRMKLQLAMMPKNEDISHLQEDVGQMQEMLQGFLDFARGLEAEPAELVNINQLIEGTVQSLRLETLKVDIFCNNSIEWYVKPTIIKRCLTNLLVNSKRYASHAQIHVEELLHSLVITIDDDGPGIQPDMREDVFKPFFRLDESRNVDTGSVGLGLSIVRDAVRSHGGQIHLEDTPSHQGLRVVIRLPR